MGDRPRSEKGTLLMAELAEAVYSLLSNDAGVAALVGDRIFPDVSPQRTPSPFVVYSTVSSSSYRHVKGPSGRATPRYQFDCYAESRLDADRLATAVRIALEGFTGTVAGVAISRITFDNRQTGIDENAEPWLRRTILDFFIEHQEATS